VTAAEGFRFPDRTFTVDPSRVEEFVLALGAEPEPGWSPRPGSLVPPGFLMYVTTYGAERIHDALGLDMLRTVFGGSDAEFLGPVRVGDTLLVRPQVTRVTRKNGQQGPLLLIELTVEYLGPSGQVVARERSTTIQRG
jgi:N-terminal half of MaoC dehydratase